MSASTLMSNRERLVELLVNSGRPLMRPRTTRSWTSSIAS